MERNRTVQIVILAVLLGISGIGGYFYRVLNASRSDADQQLEAKTQCGQTKLGEFTRGDYLLVSEQILVHTYYALSPQPRSEYYPNKLGVGVRISPTANSQLWWFDDICDMSSDFRVIKKTDPEYATVAAAWAMQELTVDPRHGQ